MNRMILTASALVLAAGVASGHGVSERPVNLEAAVDVSLTSVTPDLKAPFKALTKAKSLLAKESNAKSLGNEIKSVSKAAKKLQAAGEFTGSATIATELATLATGYRADLGASLGSIDLARDAEGLPPKIAKKLAKSQTKLEGFLADIDAAGDSAAKLSLSAKAAAAVKGWTPYDDGTDTTYVVSQLQLAPGNAGLDLDDDGNGDNALATLISFANALPGDDIDVNTTLATAIAASPSVVMLQLWNVQSFDADPIAFAGTFAAVDTDGSTADNFSGGESFTVVAGTLAGDGRATLRTVTSLSAGAYDFLLTGQALTLGGIEIPANGVVRVEGTATATTNAGKIGAAIPIGTLVQLLEDQGIDLSGFTAQLQTFADLDLNSDGTKDAFSSCFTFTTVRGLIAP